LPDNTYVLTLNPSVTDSAGNAPTEPRTFQFTVSTAQEPPVITARLANDTAPGGRTNTDGITSDPTVTGTVTDTQQLARFLATVDSAGSVDVRADRQGDGSFTFSRARLEQILGGTLTDGSHTLHLEAADRAGNLAQYGLSFPLDTTPPGAPAFDL